MIAYNYNNYQYPTSKTGEAHIVVIPSSAEYADQMVELMCAAYNCTPDETFTAEQFRTHMRVFPEGQFIAIDTDTNRVVGLTASMRVDFDPNFPLLESWVETTNYG